MTHCEHKRVHLLGVFACPASTVPLRWLQGRQPESLHRCVTLLVPEHLKVVEQPQVDFLCPLEAAQVVVDVQV